MSKEKYFSLLQRILYFGALFMLGEAIVHFSGFRLLSIQDWPAEARSFTFFFQQLWGSVSILLAFWLFQVARSRDEQRKWVWPMALFSVFHGFVLLIWGARLSSEMWLSPSLFVFNPWYNYQLTLEAALLLGFSLFSWYGRRQKWL